MVKLKFRQKSRAKRRGKHFPERLRIDARRGVTLVELMISMLILAIVCIAWLQIIGIQSARKEARRREAVERLAGMMDAFMYDRRASLPSTGSYAVTLADNRLSILKDASTNVVHSVFDNSISSIGYQLCVVSTAVGLPKYQKFKNWDDELAKCRWLVGRLYDASGLVSDVGSPFFTLPVCLMVNEE